MTTPLFLLRCVQMGVTISDLELLSVGLVLDMHTESANDREKYDYKATQEDFDKLG